jgi:hypothetical protein
VRARAAAAWSGQATGPVLGRSAGPGGAAALLLGADGGGAARLLRGFQGQAGNAAVARLVAEHRGGPGARAVRGAPVVARAPAAGGAADCDYEPGEFVRSRSDAGVLAEDVSEFAPGRLLVADFGVDWRSPKAAATSSAKFKEWRTEFETTPEYSLKVLGYTDCVGKERHNMLLRRGRARKVAAALGPGARARSTAEAAPPGSYVNDNASTENRARNRGAIIEFERKFDMEPDDPVVPQGCSAIPAQATTLPDYIHLVMCAERALPSLSPREMLSLLRKLYYSSESWSSCRGGACDGWSDVIPCGVSVADPTSALGDPLMKALRGSQVVGGVDMGHVFTGLEAATCPRSEVELDIPGPNWIVKMPNEEFATWGGDLGSAAGQKVRDSVDLNKSKPWSEYFGKPNSLASFEDLIGDIDSYVLRKQLTPGAGCSTRPAPAMPAPTGPLSASLYDYYVTQPDAAHKSAPPDRFRCFAEAIGCVIVNGQIINRSVMEDAITPRVFSFAEMYYKVKYHHGYFAGAGIGAHLLGASRKVTQLFLDWLDIHV